MATTGNSCFWLTDFFKSSLKPLGQMNRNLVGSIYGRSSVKIAHFVPIRWQIWPSKATLVSDWLIFFNSSLKPLSQINWNLEGSIYGRSSINIKSAHFVPIHWQTWLPQANLVSDWSISKNLLLWNRLAKWSETW